MTEKRSAIETELADLDARKAALQEDVAAAQTQRDELQEIVSSLTANLEERSNSLSRIEKRIAEAQQNENSMSNVNATEPQPVPDATEFETADAEPPKVDPAQRQEQPSDDGTVVSDQNAETEDKSQTSDD